MFQYAAWKYIILNCLPSLTAYAHQQNTVPSHGEYRGAKNGEVLVSSYGEDKDRGFFQQTPRWAHSAQSKLKGGGDMWLPCKVRGSNWHCCAWGITATVGRRERRQVDSDLIPWWDLKITWRVKINCDKNLWMLEEKSLRKEKIHAPLTSPPLLVIHWVKVSVLDRIPSNSIEKQNGTRKWKRKRKGNYLWEMLRMLTIYWQ